MRIFAPSNFQNLKQDKMEKTNENLSVEERINKGEQFIEKNKRIIIIVASVIAIAILGYFGFTKLYMDPKQKEASEEMFYAEHYFEQKEWEKAIKGDGKHLGFLDIIDAYSITKAANLAHYYAGVSYLQLGKYDEAITYLQGFSSDDILVQGKALGLIGDAYVELNNDTEALNYYKKAAEKGDNNIVAPEYLFKAGMLYEIQKDYTNALACYEKIKNDYRASLEGNDIDKYIAKLKMLSSTK